MASCLLIAGEKSGEEHAMSFFPELVRSCPDTQFFGVGGELLEREGLELLYHLRDFSSMGFTEVIGKIPFYFRALKHLENEVVKRGVKTAILVDFQDFNMRLASKLKKRGVNVLYFVAPQAWAWKPHRTQALSQNVHTLFTILPFEKKWFADRGVQQIRSVPHPLMLTYKDELSTLPEKPFKELRQTLKVLLLPGSRRFEVYSLLPLFIETIKLLRQDMKVEVHAVRVPHIQKEFYELFKKEINVWYSSEELPKALKACHVSLAASGTVTLSTGLFELPTVVCYKAGLLNEFIFYNFVKYKGPISLTNIIHGHSLFPEFVQAEVEPAQLARVIRTWSTDEKVYNEIKLFLRETKNLLSGENFSVPQYMARVIHE